MLQFLIFTNLLHDLSIQATFEEVSDLKIYFFFDLKVLPRIDGVYNILLPNNRLSQMSFCYESLPLSLILLGL